MIKLILPIVFLSPSLFAASGTVNEIINKDESKALVSTVKDIEVKDMLEKTKEFSECRKMNAFDASDSPSKRSEKLASAETCIKKKLGEGGSNPKKLQEFSEALNLQSYGLVKSNSVKDIQKYLNDKMYKSLTGVDRNEADKQKLVESLRFGKKKNVDQKLFVSLYKAQLSKNALYEISRFCFEDLRKINRNTVSNFGDHWADFSGALDLSEITDTGEPKFGTLQDPSDKEKVYTDLFNSMNIGSKGFPIAQLNNFFLQCGQMINQLCKEFKNSDKAVLNKSESDVETTPARGAASCLALNRIQDIKKGLVSSDLIEKEFEKMQPSQLANSLISGNYYGSNAGEESIDNLTNYTSQDILEGSFSKNASADQKSKDCLDKPELSSCEGFLTDGEELDKVKQKIEMEMTIKREVEMERVRKLKTDGESKLTDYLKENGFFDILKEYEKLNGKMDESRLVELIGNEFEARKVAMLSQINNKLGKRQTKKSDDPKKTDDVTVAAKEGVNASKEERARLAQVVLFNNIITSHLNLERKDAKGDLQKAGRNVNAWKKEEGSLKTASIDSGLFSNLKSTDDEKGIQGIGQNEQLGGIGLIDQILGAPAETKKP
jgi:hypothetical protein